MLITETILALCRPVGAAGAAAAGDVDWICSTAICAGACLSIVPADCGWFSSMIFEAPDMVKFPFYLALFDGSEKPSGRRMTATTIVQRRFDTKPYIAGNYFAC
jgi:hypothetical protein